MKVLLSTVRVIMFLCVINTVSAIGGGHWEQVHKADWPFGLEKVFFINEQKGWILGAHRELLFTTNGGEQWNQYQFDPQLHEKLTGYLEDVHFIDEQTGWIVGHEGIILKTTDAGNSWRFINTGTTIDFEAVDFSDSLRGCVVGRDGNILNTTDGGETWHQQYQDPNQWWMSDVCFVDSLIGWVVSRKGAIFHSDNGGTTWNQQFVDTDMWLTSLFFISDKIGWVVGNESVMLKTKDGGKNWEVNTNITGTKVWLSAIFFLNPDTGWVVGCGSGAGELMKTVDGGETWFTAECPSHTGLLDIFFLNDSAGWTVGKNGTIINTINGGTTWNWQMNFPATTIYSIFFTDNDNGWASCASGLLHTTEGGLNWEIVTEEIGGGQIYFLNKNKAWMPVWGVGLYVTEDAWQSWYLHDSLKYLHELYFINEHTGWAFGFTRDSMEVKSTFAVQTKDGGKTWNKLFELYGRQVNEFCFVDTLNGWMTGQDGAVYRTRDGGFNWELLIELKPNSDDMLNIAFVDTLYGWTASYGEIWQTTDGGKSWNKQNIETDSPIRKIIFFDRHEGWSVGDCAILHTTDGGITWYDTYSGTGGYLLRDAFFTDRDHGWLAGDNGAIFKWMPELAVEEIARLANLSTDYLHQNYPNPFNPETEIRYQLPEAAHVTLKIFNLLGQHVTTLVDSEELAGEHSARWDGRDAGGRELASGIYIYRLEAGSFGVSKKLALIR